MAELLLYLGDAERLAGDAHAAKVYLERAHDLIKKPAQAFPQAMPVAVLLAKSYLRLDGIGPDPGPLRDQARAALERVGEARLDGDGTTLLQSLRP